MTVDVIIPAFNNGARIRAAMDSALGQTFRDVRIVVIDDGSTDGTRGIVKQYLGDYPGKVRYVYQENKGPASARNRGLKESQGKYIAFLDADDTWLPEKLAQQVSVLEGNPGAGFVYTNNYFVDEKGLVINDYVRKIKLTRGDVLLDLFLDHFIMTPGVMMRRDCLEETGLFNETLRVGEDYEFFLRLAQKFQAEVIEEPLWNRTVIADSLSRQDYWHDAQNDLQTLKTFVRNHPEFRRKYPRQISRRFSDMHFALGYRLLEDGRNGPAFFQLVGSLNHRLSLPGIKNLALCAVPFGIRTFLKKG